MPRCSLLAVLTVAMPISAQAAIATVYANPPTVQLGYQIGPIGDVDGDARPDLLVSSYSPTLSRVHLISSATFAVLGSVNGTGAVGASDMNLDGKSDFLVVDSVLRAHSGNAAAVLWTCPLPYTFHAACGISDLDTDGKPDVAAAVTIGGTRYLVTLRGSDGSQMAISAALSLGTPVKVFSIGDIDGDGRVEVGVADQYRVDIYKPSLAVSFLRTLQIAPATYVKACAAGNVAGDAKKEVLLGGFAVLNAYSATNGTLVRTYTTNDPTGLFTVMGDLDGDGFDDFARLDVDTRLGYTPNPSVVFVSGANGAFLANWSNQYPRFRAAHLEGVGDVDGDGFADLLLGDENASPTGLLANQNGGWQLVSGKVLANRVDMPTTCGGGPFLPQLGATRPILGQTMTLVGRDCPLGTIGVLAFSLRPDFPTNIGFSGCDVWLGAWSALHMPPPLATWTFSVAVPGAPQLAGLQLAMQAFYVGTTSPIGIDLSNGIWMRLGF